MAFACDNPKCSYHAYDVDPTASTAVVIVEQPRTLYEPSPSAVIPRPPPLHTTTICRQQYAYNGKSGWFCSRRCAEEGLRQ